MPFLLGLTGNIGCGKSSVGKLLVERYGVEYLDSDALVHELYAPGTESTALIAARFGEDLLTAENTIDRRKLGAIVLPDPEQMRDLEAILHPRVRKLTDARIEASRAAVVVIDAIKLFEVGLADRCQAVWVVTADRETQKQRLMATRGFTAEQAELRIDAQPPQEEKAAKATCVIENRGTLEELERAVADAWARSVAPALSNR